jgi:ProQ/FINO family
MCGTAGMTPLKIERDRGRKEAGQQLEVLRERWPLAFPVQAQDVRPLAMGVANQIAETMGWSLSYSVGVLTYWKMSAVYCRAVLAHDQRITLDGMPVEAVDEGAKDLATKQLIRLGLRERREADLARQGEALGTLLSDRIVDMIPSGEPLVQPVVRTLGTKGEHQVTLPDQSQAAHGGEGQAALNQIDDTRD